MKCFRLEITDRVPIIYANWWDMINTGIVIGTLTAAFAVVSLDFLNIVECSWIRAYTNVIRNREDVGVGLTSLTVTGGSAAGLWILSHCVPRWSTIRNFRDLSNDMLRNIKLPSPASAASDTNAALTLSVHIRTYIDIVLNSRTSMLLLSNNAQKLTYENIARLNQYLMLLDGSLKGQDPHEISALHNRILASFCLIVFYLNRTPRFDQQELSRIQDNLFARSCGDPVDRELFNALQRFRSFPRNRQSIQT